MLRFVAEMPSPISGVGLQQMHGAASCVNPAATAFPHRDEHYDFLILSQWADPSDSEENVRWTRAFFEAMEPFFEQGSTSTTWEKREKTGLRRRTARTTGGW
jgi:hypothetical protein